MVLDWNLGFCVYYSFILIRILFSSKRPVFNKYYAWEIISKGKHFIVIVGVGFIMNYSDDLIIGSVLGASVLGLYTVAYKLSDTIVQILDKSLNRSILPKLAEIKSDVKAHSDRFFELFQIQMIVLIPLSLVVFYWAEPIIRVFLGLNLWMRYPY